MQSISTTKVQPEAQSLATDSRDTHLPAPFCLDYLSTHFGFLASDVEKMVRHPSTPAGIEIFFKADQALVAQKLADTLTRRGVMPMHSCLKNSVKLYDFQKESILAAGNWTCDEPFVPVNDVNNDLFDIDGKITSTQVVSGYRNADEIILTVSNLNNPGQSKCVRIVLAGADVVNIVDGGYETKTSAATILHLVEIGLLKPTIFQTLRISERDIQESQKAVAELARLKKNTIKELRSQGSYTGSKNNTVVVLQGEAHILESGCTDIHRLYTSGAMPCSIVIGIAKNKAGKVIRVGMAHFDATARKSSVHAYFQRIKGDEEKFEIAIVGGDAQLATRVLRAADQAGAPVIFADANLDQTRVDAAAVDSLGNIYYGADQ